jgi:hypothetical protein
MAYTNIDDPSAHFQTALWTGTNAVNKVITNDGNSDLKPDLIWAKARTSTSYTDNHFIVDSSRGRTKGLVTNNTSAETTTTGNQSENDLLSFNTDGFTVGIVNSTAALNAIDASLVGWQWKANGGSTSSNTAGTITSTVQANTDAGFSIVTWTGNSSNATIGHGLGVRPDVIIQKARGTTSNWNVYHKDATNGQQPYNVITNLNLSDATGIASNSWGTTASDITSSVFYLKYWINYNTTNLAYCFAEKQGYSRFGKYVGNGNANGAFVYTGFKPAFVIVKKSTGTGNWLVYDNKRGAFNLNDEYIYGNEPNAEATSSTSGYDFLSNGFKTRNTYNDGNVSGQTYIYMAFAEHPFTTSTGVPACAR